MAGPLPPTFQDRSWRRLSSQGPAQRGGAVAVFAIARKLATLVYRMLRYGQDYVDIGEQAYEARFRRLASLNAAAQSLGYALIEKEAAIG